MFLHPAGGLLIGVGELQASEFVLIAPDDLHSHRQPARIESDGHIQ